MLMFGNAKKKKHPVLVIAVTAFAVYGAYSMVSSAKECCCMKMEKIMSLISKKKKNCSSGGEGDSSASIQSAGAE